MTITSKESVKSALADAWNNASTWNLWYNLCQKDIKAVIKAKDGSTINLKFLFKF